MNKSELIDAIAAEAGLTKTDTKKAIDAFVKSVSGALKTGDKVTMVGFGTFAIAERAARTGRNPLTGKDINIAAKKVVRFKPGSELSETVQ